MVNSEILMSLLRKGLIGIPARRLTNISNGAGGGSHLFTIFSPRNKYRRKYKIFHRTRKVTNPVLQGQGFEGTPK